MRETKWPLHLVSCNDRSGFTLIEIIIALFIFAILAVIAAVGMRTVLNTYDKVNKVTDRIRQLEVAMTLMRRDFTQIIQRPVVGNGGELLPALSVSSTSALEFTRAGNSNPQMLLPRSSLQRVSYSVDDDKLIRTVWPVLDRTDDTKPLSRVILNQVQSMSLGYVDQNGQLITNWVGNTGANSATLTALPQAIVVTLQIKAAGKMQAVFRLTGRGLSQ